MCKCNPPRRPLPNGGTSSRRSSGRGTSSLALPQRSEIADVEDAPAAVRGRLPLGLDAHPDPNLVLRHLAEVVHHPHPRRGAVEAHDPDEDRLRNSLGIRVEIRNGERFDRPRVVNEGPLVRGPEALFAEHPWGKEDALALVARSRDEATVLEFFEEPRHRFARGPSVLRVRPESSLRDLALKEVGGPEL